MIDITSDRGPSTFFGLTPAEAYLLLEPDSTEGHKAIKLTLMWLLARRIIEIRQEPCSGFLGRPKVRSLLHVARPLPPDLPRYVIRLIGVIDLSPDRRVDRLWPHLAKTYGQGGYKLLREDVLSLLLEKRLVERYTGKLLGLIPIERRRRTRDGEELARRVEGALADARTIPSLLDRDPRQAAALAFAAGGLIFLVPELLPELSAIATAARNHQSMSGGDGGPAVTSSSSDDRDGASWAPLDISVIDSLGGAFESFGSDFDSGGGDGGGDGGGGGD